MCEDCNSLIENGRRPVEIPEGIDPSAVEIGEVTRIETVCRDTGETVVLYRYVYVHACHRSPYCDLCLRDGVLCYLLSRMNYGEKFQDRARAWQRERAAWLPLYQAGLAAAELRQKAANLAYEQEAERRRLAYESEIARIGMIKEIAEGYIRLALSVPGFNRGIIDELRRVVASKFVDTGSGRDHWFDRADRTVNRATQEFARLSSIAA